MKNAKKKYEKKVIQRKGKLSQNINFYIFVDYKKAVLNYKNSENTILINPSLQTT